MIDQWSWKKAALAAVKVALDPGAHKIVLEHRAGAGGLDGKIPFIRLGLVPAGTAASVGTGTTGGTPASGPVLHAHLPPELVYERELLICRL